MDVKGPMLPTYAEHYGPTPVPEWVYADWGTTNMQVITGAKSPTPTKIIVVDLDGPRRLDSLGPDLRQPRLRAGRGWADAGLGRQAPF